MEKIKSVREKMEKNENLCQRKWRKGKSAQEKMEKMRSEKLSLVATAALEHYRGSCEVRVQSIC